MIRKFSEEDIPYKVRWINDSKNNQYLHYTLPLSNANTRKWYMQNKDSTNRLDMTILYDCKPIGVIGLLNIDIVKRDAELYITIGEQEYKGIGVAGKAMHQLVQIGFQKLRLNTIYLFTESGNLAAIRAYEKFGFRKTGEVLRTRQNPECIVTMYRYEINKDNYEMRYGLQNNDSYT